MTCIVAIKGDKFVHIGADSAGVSHQTVMPRADEKCFTVGDFIFGFTTSFRMGQLLRYSFTPPSPESDDDIHRFMCTDFIDRLRECLKTGGYATKDKEQEEGGTFLVGYKNHLFEIDDDYQVGKHLVGYAAIGSGRDFALGSLNTSRNSSDISERLSDALSAAALHCSTVARPFKYVSTDTLSWHVLIEH